MLSCAALVPIASMACQGDECQVGEAKCEDGLALNCDKTEEGGDLEFTGPGCFERTCVVASKDGRQHALCALESEPRPACPTDSFAWACDGSMLLLCNWGFVVEQSNCGDSSLCEPTVPFCLVHPGPDPVCEAAPHLSGFAHFCEGDVLVKCLDAFRIEQEECGPGLCFEGPPYASCIASSTPDPRCEEQFDPMHGTSFCDGNTLVKCDGHFLVEQHDCGGALCMKLEGNAFAECG